MHKMAKLAHKIEQLDICVRRLALLEMFSWAFLLGPAGIDEGETMSDRLELLLGGARFLQGTGLRPKGAVLSGGRMEDRGRCERLDWCLLVDIYSLSTGLKKCLIRWFIKLNTILLAI